MNTKEIVEIATEKKASEKNPFQQGRNVSEQVGICDPSTRDAPPRQDPRPDRDRRGGRDRNSPGLSVCQGCARSVAFVGDRKSTRLNSSHMSMSYAVCCLKKNRTCEPCRGTQIAQAVHRTDGQRAQRN